MQAFSRYYIEAEYYTYKCAHELQDGEVESFTLLPLAEVAALVAETDEFKDNCNLVIIDFLIRHGYIVPEQPGYLALLAGMRQGDCS